MAADLATINGVSLADRVQSLEWAREIVEFRADVTARAIMRAIANRGTIPAPVRAARGGGGGRGGRGGRGGQARPEPNPRTMGGGQLRRERVQLLGHAQSPAEDRHHVDRRDDLDGRPGCSCRRQDDGHYLDGRHGAERAVAGYRQAQLRASHQLRRQSHGNSAMRCVLPSWNWFPRAASTRRAATCAARAP